MLKVKNLHCQPVGEAPIYDLSLDLSPGEIVVLSGPNGAGKSTFCHCMASLRSPAKGEIHLDGLALPSTPWDVARSGLIVVLKGRRVFPELTVDENLMVSSHIRKSNKRQIHEIFDLFPNLAERRKQRGGTLSGGEQQMVAIGRALMSNPRILVLEEPSLGLAPLVVANLYQALRLVRKNGVGILVTEEDVSHIGSMAKRIYYLVQGRFVSDPDQALSHCTAV